MATTTISGIIIQYNGETPTFAGTTTLNVFSTDTVFSYSYIFPNIDFYDVEIPGSEYYSMAIGGLPWDVVTDEIALAEVTFNSGLTAEYASFYDIENDREFMFEMSRSSAAIPDLPTSASQVDAFIAQLVSLDYIDTASGSGTTDLATWTDATSSEVDVLDFTGLISNDVFDLGAGNDTCYSGAGSDSILGGDGNDRLVARGNNDSVVDFTSFWGDAGNDILKFKLDVRGALDGGAGDDKLIGADFDDSLDGGAGSDILIALDGDDTLDGMDDRDFVYGGKGNDIVRGGAGDDEVRGNRGNDDLFGDDGADDLRGGGNDDDLSGGAGNDFLFGENGRDTLNGGAGDDVLTGGIGGGASDGLRDVFVWDNASFGGGGFDRVKDFEDGIDVLDLRLSGATDFDEVFGLAADTAGGLRIKFAPGEVLFLDGFAKADFDVTDILI